MEENIIWFLVIDFAEFFPLAVAYLGFFSVPVDFKLEGLLGGWFVGCFFFLFGVIIDMALWHPY